MPTSTDGPKYAIYMLKTMILYDFTKSLLEDRRDPLIENLILPFWDSVSGGNQIVNEKFLFPKAFQFIYEWRRDKNRMLPFDRH